MKLSVRLQLSLMMFLQFFIWGSWYVTMGSYLDALELSDFVKGNAYSTTGWGAIAAPFFIGMIADRFFSAQKVLGILHLLGAVLMYYVTTVESSTTFFIVLLGYTICYMPTLALVNTIAMYQLDNAEKEFSQIRVMGTIGWIAAGGMILLLAEFQSLETIETTAQPMLMAAIASALLGIYAFTLPNTPPQSVGEKVTVSDVLNLDALKLLKDRSFAILLLCSLLVCIPLTFYYNFTNNFFNEVGLENPAFKMTFGQMSEFFFLLVMPFFFTRLGVKKMILIGILAWVVRYVLFAFGNSDTAVWMFYGGIILHGVCFDFFFVTGQVYVDRAAPKKLRASAQGLIALVTYGVGMVIGSYVSGIVVNHFALEDGGHQWRQVWLVPGAMAFIVMILFAVLFKDHTRTTNANTPEEETPA